MRERGGEGKEDGRRQAGSRHTHLTHHHHPLSCEIDQLIWGWGRRGEGLVSLEVVSGCVGCTGVG